MKISIMSVTIIIMLLLAILLVIFTLQNSFEISLNVFIWEIHNAPMVLVLLVCILLGYIMGTIYFYPQIWRLNKRLRRTSNTERKLETELLELRRKTSSNPEGIELDIENEEEENRGFFRE